MISASDLNELLTVLKKHSANVLRYKSGTGDSGEEIEIIISSESSSTSEMTDATSSSAKLKLIGFQQDEDDEE
jgi:hypothetical protein